MISRYLDLIRLSLRQIAEYNRKPTDFACPILSKKSQLCYTPERRESFTSRSTEVIKLLLVVDIKFHEKSLRETVHVSELLIH